MDRNTVDSFTQAHTHGFNAKCIEEAGKGVALPDTSIEGVRATICPINVHTCVAAVDYVLDHGGQIRADPHGHKNADEPGQIRAIICLGLVKADNVTVSVCGVRQMGNLDGESGVLSNETSRDKALLVLM